MLDLMVVNNASRVALHFHASAVPDSMIIAFEICLSSQIHPEIRELPFYCRHLGFPVERYTSSNVGVGTVEKFDPENIGVVAGILFLSALELETHLGEILPPGQLILYTERYEG
jgi:hypothetical protein